eukprot:564607-Rhodomonas_salina.1
MPCPNPPARCRASPFATATSVARRSRARRLPETPREARARTTAMSSVAIRRRCSRRTPICRACAARNSPLWSPATRH